MPLIRQRLLLHLFEQSLSFPTARRTVKVATTTRCFDCGPLPRFIELDENNAGFPSFLLHERDNGQLLPSARPSPAIDPEQAPAVTVVLAATSPFAESSTNTVNATCAAPAFDVGGLGAGHWTCSGSRGKQNCDQFAHSHCFFFRNQLMHTGQVVSPPCMLALASHLLTAAGALRELAVG